MYFKTIIFITIFLTFLCLNGYAAPSRDDCNELKTSLSYVEIENCKVNNKGEMTELNFSSSYTVDSVAQPLSDSDYKKILSYATIRKLNFNDEYSNCNGLNNGISNLKDLKELNIRSFRGTIAPNILKDLKSLKSFTYDAGDYHVGHLSQENINELSSLPKLEKIKFSYVDIDEEKLDFKPLQNLKLSSLILETNGKRGINLKGLVSNIKSLKELIISGFDIVSQEEFDAITSSEIEKLTINIDKDIKIENFKNLKNLTYLNLTMKDVKDVPKSINNIPSLKTLIFNNKEIINNTKNNNNKENTNTNGNGENDTIEGNANNSKTNVIYISNVIDEPISSDSNEILDNAIYYLPFVLLFIMF